MSRFQSLRGGGIFGQSPPALRSLALRFQSFAIAAFAAIPLCGMAQGIAHPASSVEAATSSAGAPLTLENAIARARINQPELASAIATARNAALEHAIARAALLPSVVYHNQYLYTQPAHGPTQSANASAAATTSIPRFIANNAVHEYTSQGVVNETIGVQQMTAVARSSANAAAASAELEIAQRNLTLTVVRLYYGSVAAEHKAAVARQALYEANNFTQLTQQRERARESAHADVIKAQLQQLQRQREVADSQLESERARLDLGVLVFLDPRTDFTLTNAGAPQPLATKEEVEAAAAKSNPEIKSAMETLRAASLDVAGARAAYLPELGLNFNYGIDAPEFAVHAPDGTRNLGYSAQATLDIPIWDWFATHDRVKQKVYQRDAARVALSAAQKRLLAQLNEAYGEARVAQDQLQSLDLSAETARESLRLVRLRYSSGESTVLEVVDAQNSVATAEVARENGILRYQTALADLQVLTGTM
jgi:outer membrane protein TolC